MPQPPQLIDLNPMVIGALTKLISFIGGIVLSLVGVLYWLLRETDKKQQEQLDSGQDEFVTHSLELERMKKDIESMRKWIQILEAELTAFELKQVKDHEAFILICDQHRRNHKDK